MTMCASVCYICGTTPDSVIEVTTGYSKFEVQVAVHISYLANPNYRLNIFEFRHTTDSGAAYRKLSRRHIVGMLGTARFPSFPKRHSNLEFVQTMCCRERWRPSPCYPCAKESADDVLYLGKAVY